MARTTTGGMRRRRDGRWQVTVQVNGKRHWWYCRTEREAKALLERLRRELVLGQYQPPTALTLADWLAQDAALREGQGLRPSTLATERQVLGRLAGLGLGRVRLHQLTPVRVAAALAALRRAGMGSRRLELAYTCLRASLNRAVRLGLLSHNPVERVPKPRHAGQERVRPIWTVAQAQAFLAAAAALPPAPASAPTSAPASAPAPAAAPAPAPAGPSGGQRQGRGRGQRQGRGRGQRQGQGPGRYAPAFVLQLATGLRPSELLGLRWKDWDAAAGTLAVERAVVWRRNSTYSVEAPKSRAGRRVIVVPAVGRQALAALGALGWGALGVRAQRPQGDRTPGPGRDSGRDSGPGTAPDPGMTPDPEAPIVVARNGAVPRPAALVRALAEQCRRAGVPTLTPHQLRAVHASLVVAGGVDLKTVQRRLGHARLSMTADTYARPLRDDHEAAAVVDRLLAGPGAGAGAGEGPGKGKVKNEEG